MSSVRKFTDREILDRITSLPNFDGFKPRVLDAWIRSQKDEYDRFDDVVFTYTCFGGLRPPRFEMKCTGTTNAGSFGLKNFRTYNPLGCAVLKSDTIVYNSHLPGLHKGYPAYRQAKPFPYYRDKNGNNRAEEIGEIYYDIILANCHRAGLFSTVISNWSVACLVRNSRTEWDRWLAFMGKRPLSVAILKEF